MSYPTAKGKVCVQNPPPQSRPKRKLANAPFQSHEAFADFNARGGDGDGSVVSSNQRQRGADELTAQTRTTFSVSLVCLTEPKFYPPLPPT